MSGVVKRARETHDEHSTPPGKDNMVRVRGKMVDLETLNPKERRRVKNILSAQRSREKTKEHITKLENRVADGEKRIANLVRENYALRSMLATLMSQATKGASVPAIPAVPAAPGPASTPRGECAAPPSRPLPVLVGASSPSGSPTGGESTDSVTHLPVASGVRAVRMLRSSQSRDAIKVETTPSPSGRKDAKRPRRPTRTSARIRATANASPNQAEDAAFAPAPPAAIRGHLISGLNMPLTPPKGAITVTTPGAGDAVPGSTRHLKQISLISPGASLMGSLPEPLSLMSNSGAFGSPMVVGSPAAVPHRPDSFLRMSGWAEESGEMPGKNVVGPSTTAAAVALCLDSSSHLRNDSVETAVTGVTGGPSVATTVSSTMSDAVTGTVLKDACMSSPLMSPSGWSF